MAKINRFHLLIAALIYAKSYNVASAAYLHPMTDYECGILQKLLTQLDTYGSEGQADTYMASWCIQQDGGTDGDHYALYEDQKAYLLSCAFRSSTPVLDIKDCSVQEGVWGCGVYECASGYGYNTSSGSCERCVAGEYRQTDDWGSWYGPRCRPCPDRTYSGTYPTSNASTADAATDCYVPSSQTWTTTSNGTTYVTKYSSDCYYSGNAGDVGTVGS